MRRRGTEMGRCKIAIGEMYRLRNFTASGGHRRGGINERLRPAAEPHT